MFTKSRKRFILFLALLEIFQLGMAQTAIPDFDFSGNGNAYTSIASQFSLSEEYLLVSKAAEGINGFTNLG
jgi:hypothetical protein